MISLARAQIGKVSTLSDGSIKVELFLPELPAHEMTELFQAKKKGEIPVMLPAPAPKIEGKTPSQRLRNTIFCHWEQNTDRATPFDEYYTQVIEAIINQFKQKLT